MILAFTCVVLFYASLSEGKRLKTVCEGGACLHLYDNGNSYLTWFQAFALCHNEGLEMLTMESSQLDAALERLLDDLPQFAPGSVWIGARQSTDPAWRYINGSLFNTQAPVTTYLPHQNCIYITLCRSYNPQYAADGCSSRYSALNLLCQHVPRETGKCNSPGVLRGDKCYVLTMLNGTGTGSIDWYNGQTYCSSSATQGSIAYSYVGDQIATEEIAGLLLTDSKSCAQLWTGIRRMPWVWKPGFGSKMDNEPISFFNWDYVNDVDSSANGCIYLNRFKGNKWFSTECHRHTSRYAVCMNSQQTPKRNISTAAGGGSRKMTTVTIVLIVVSLLFVAALITLFVYCIYSRRRIRFVRSELEKIRHIGVTRRTYDLPTTANISQISGQIDPDTDYEEYELNVESEQNHDDQDCHYEKPAAYENTIYEPSIYQSVRDISASGCEYINIQSELPLDRRDLYNDFELRRCAIDQ